MNKKTESVSDSVSSALFLSPEDEKMYRVEIPAYVTDDRKNLPENDQTSEYYTVNFEITMDARRRRLLLDTILNMVYHRDQWMKLSLADYIIIETLFTQILENDSPAEDRQEKFRANTQDLLGAAKFFLQSLPVQVSKQVPVKGVPRKYVADRFETYLPTFRFNNLRTHQSRVATYWPARIFKFSVILPLVQPDFHKGEPYSSYTKGYQESHPKHLQTATDWEIDGIEIHEFQKTQSLEPTIIPVFSVEEIKLF